MPDLKCWFLAYANETDTGAEDINGVTVTAVALK